MNTIEKSRRDIAKAIKKMQIAIDAASRAPFATREFSSELDGFICNLATIRGIIDAREASERLGCTTNAEANGTAIRNAVRKALGYLN